MEKEQQIINFFLEQSTPELAKKHRLSLKKENDYFSDEDTIIGTPMSKIKAYVQNSPILDISIMFNLIQSEYNEIRLLGWSLLIRDYSEAPILKYFVLYQSKTCGNWNVVDFAAPLCSRMLLKRTDSDNLVTTIGYDLLFKQENIWTTRFALMLSVPLIENANFNYAIDSIERVITHKDISTQKTCGFLLNKIKQNNPNIFKYFFNDNRNKLTPFMLEQIE